ncbi:uncharacterized protein [Phaseolus vulgaris]|uniref:uncharacterized protein n=1 Tax=Phaseolus vulgaris TaxID=3885 RepID=UPI0035CC85EC
MAMLMQLQEELETLKKSNEEELSMLRAENAYMRQRLNGETALNTSPRNFVNERENKEESFGVTQRKIPETSGVAVETPVRRHPFSETIIETPLPDNWKSLTIEKYDGSTDPDEHVAIYTTQISLYTWNDAILCRVFPTTLKGAALSWFTRLPPLSVDCFDTLIEKFGAQFATSRPHHLTSIALVNIRQEQNESLRAFMERFGRMALSIRNLSPEVSMHHMITALRPGPFADSLCKKPAVSLDELRRRAAKFMQMEELRDFRNQARMDVKNEKKTNEREAGYQSRRFREEPRGRKFQQYTPLSTTRTRILQVIPPPRKARTPDRADHSKRCQYHKNHGHHTEECIALKDRIEELIQTGQLKRFVRVGRMKASQSPEQDVRGRGEKFGRTTDIQNDRKERRGGRDEKRDLRSGGSHPHSQERRSQQRSLGRPVRGFINTISGGFPEKETYNTIGKKYLRGAMTVNYVFKRRSLPPMLFTDEDFQDIDPDQRDPMVITIEIARYAVMKTLVDQGSPVDILFWETFKKLHLKEQDMVLLKEQIIGFSGEKVDTKGYIDLPTTFGRGNATKTITIRYLVVDTRTSYNALLGRSLLNKLGAIVSTPHLAMKFPTERGDIATIYVDQKAAKECYATGLKMVQEPRVATGSMEARNMVAMVDLDPRMNDDERIEPREEITSVQLGEDETQCTYVGGSMPEEMIDDLVAVIRMNKDLFAWKASDIPGIDHNIISHKLSVCREARPIAQKRRKLGEER